MMKKIRFYANIIMIVCYILSQITNNINKGQIVVSILGFLMLLLSFLITINYVVKFLMLKFRRS